MQDIQNIPNPDVNSIEDNGDFGNHSNAIDLPDTDVEQPNDLPLPPDKQQNAPVEEPPETRKPKIDEDNPQPKKIV